MNSQIRMTNDETNSNNRHAKNSRFNSIIPSEVEDSLIDH